MKRIRRHLGHTCWLCGRNGQSDPLDKHHIFGGALRQKSEACGLYVYLCHSRCHEFGKNAVHANRETARRLHQYGQKLAMREQDWTIEDFRREFGKNYLDDDDLGETGYRQKEEDLPFTMGE